MTAPLRSQMSPYWTEKLGQAIKPEKYRECWKKVALYALGLFLFFPALIGDLFHLACRFISRFSLIPYRPIEKSGTKGSDRFDSALIARLTENPFKNGLPWALSNVEFFQSALEHALQFHSAEERKKILLLIEEDGTCDNPDEAPITPYTWEAGCFIVHGLRSGLQNEPEELSFSEGRELRKIVDLEKLRGQYKELSIEEQRGALLKIIRPKEQIILSGKGKKFVDEVQKEAASMCQSQDWVGKIYRPVKENLKKISDSFP